MSEVLSTLPRLPCVLQKEQRALMALISSEPETGHRRPFTSFCGVSLAQKRQSFAGEAGAGWNVIPDASPHFLLWMK